MRKLEFREVKTLAETRSSTSRQKQYSANIPEFAFKYAIIYSANYNFCRHGNPEKGI